MSLASYIGCNVEIPLTDPDSNDVIVLDRVFQMKVCLKLYKIINSKTNYIYEVSTNWELNLSSGKM